MTRLTISLSQVQAGDYPGSPDRKPDMSALEIKNKPGGIDWAVAKLRKAGSSVVYQKTNWYEVDGELMHSLAIIKMAEE